MSKNRIVIDLSKVAMTPDQLKDLHVALHKTVVRHLAKDPAISSPVKSKSARKASRSMSMLAAAHEGPQTATLNVTITGTESGDSTITATLNGNAQTLNQSGKIRIDNVNSGDIIEITGDSLGTTTITIDIPAHPTMLTFPPGGIDDNFFVK
jgi:hypothetical protein